MRRIAAASAVGTGIELYDFLIFGLAAGLVFPELFFPDSDPIMGTLQSFLAFGAGFLSRPVGGVLFGHFGDRVSRRTMLVVALVGTGGCTVMMGALPTYASVGVLAPVLLVALRTLQGLFMGGEQSGAFLLVSEHAPAGHKAFWGAFVTAGSPIGSILGIGVFQITAHLTGEQFAVWGWRVPFLLSAVLVVIGIYIRLGVAESPVMARLAASGHTQKLPLAAALRHAFPLVIAGILVNLGFNLFIFIVNSFATAYGVQIGFTRTDMLLSGVCGSFAMLVFVFVAGRLADRFGILLVMGCGAVFQVLFAFPFFWMLDSGQVGLLYLATVLAYIGLSFVFGPMASYYVRLFDPEYRYSGVAFSYSLGAVLGGGLSPSIATALLAAFGSSAGISWYVAFGGVLSLLGLWLSARRVRMVGEG